MIWLLAGILVPLIIGGATLVIAKTQVEMTGNQFAIRAAWTASFIAVPVAAIIIGISLGLSASNAIAFWGATMVLMGTGLQIARAATRPQTGDEPVYLVRSTFARNHVELLGWAAMFVGAVALVTSSLTT